MWDSVLTSPRPRTGAFSLRPGGAWHTQHTVGTQPILTNSSLPRFHVTKPTLTLGAHRCPQAEGSLPRGPWTTPAAAGQSPGDAHERVTPLPAVWTRHTNKTGCSVSSGGGPDLLSQQPHTHTHTHTHTEEKSLEKNGEQGSLEAEQGCRGNLTMATCNSHENCSAAEGSQP